MKTLNKLFVLCIIVMSSYGTKAQVVSSSRPQLFRTVSDRLPTAITELDKAFTAPEGTSVKFKFYNLAFSGTVTSSIKRYDNLYSVIIKSSSLDNTLLSISKRINEDKTITYVARILNENYADGYELIKANDGSYAFNKIKTEALIQDY
ncbi:MAG TPA: hypothetical protein VGW31_02280 [Hanamia sp.]|jgi:hypothetical protein|nr:hypothetical protein [Hanamia sp.]